MVLNKSFPTLPLNNSAIDLYHFWTVFNRDAHARSILMFILIYIHTIFSVKLSLLLSTLSPSISMTLTVTFPSDVVGTLTSTHTQIALSSSCLENNWGKMKWGAEGSMSQWVHFGFITMTHISFIFHPLTFFLGLDLFKICAGLCRQEDGDSLTLTKDGGEYFVVTKHL